MSIRWIEPPKVEAKIESPATITRRPYRCRQHGQTVHYGVESGAHYSDRPRASHREDESKRETENRRFVRASTLAWGALIEESEA